MVERILGYGTRFKHPYRQIWRAQAVGTYIGESKLNAQEIRQLNNPTHSNDRVTTATE